MAASQVLLPGEEISADQLLKSKKGTLTLGPGLRHLPPSTIATTTTGLLAVDHRKAAAWLESGRSGGYYQPALGDLVIAQVHHGSADTWHCSITPHTPYALLGQLSFEGVSRKTRPQFDSGDLVYARVCRTSKWEETELECVNSATGKAEGMGALKGGMVFEVSPAFARRLMLGAKKGGVGILEEVGEKVKFEVAVGRNGRVWIDSGSVKSTIVIGRLLKGADEEEWDLDMQSRMVKRMLKEV